MSTDLPLSRPGVDPATGAFFSSYSGLDAALATIIPRAPFAEQERDAAAKHIAETVTSAVALQELLYQARQSYGMDRATLTTWIHRGCDLLGVPARVDKWGRYIAPLEGRATLATLGEVQEEPITWFWWPYIALGTLTVLDGNPGIGKSLLTAAFATHSSLGSPFPDQQGAMQVPCPLGDVLFFAQEDSLSQRLKPRLTLLGADQSRIYAFQGWHEREGLKERPFDLQHMGMLRACLDQYPGVRLVILDPLQAYWGPRVNQNQANETRPLLQALATLAQERQVAVLLVRHMAKSSGDSSLAAMMAGLGSIDIVGACRSGFVLAPHPLHQDAVLLCHAKSNAQRGRTMIFRKDDGRFAWCGVSRLDPEAIAGNTRGPYPRERLRAALWLEERLAGGLYWPSTDLFADYMQGDYEEEKVAMRALRDGKRLLPIEVRKKGEHWEWRLPDFSTRIM